MTENLPIREWRIRNLKAVEKADLELGQLTVIVGANSSGKSTVLQSILLAVQAAQTQSQGDVFPLNGLLVQLGEFKDAHSLFAKTTSSSIGAVFDLSGRHESRVVDWQIDFKGSEPSQPGSTKLIGASFSVKTEEPGARPRRRVAVSAAARARRSEDLPLMSGFRAPSRLAPSEQTIVRWPGTVRLESATRHPISGLNLAGGMPSHFVKEADEHEELADRWIQRAAEVLLSWRGPSAADDGRYRRQGDPTLGDLVHTAVKDIRQTLDAQTVDAPWTELSDFKELSAATARNALGRSLRDALIDPEALNELRSGIYAALGPGRRVAEPELIDGGIALSALRLLAEGVTYLGPLRQEPQVIYRTFSPAQPRNLGTKGEYTVPVLYRLRHEEIAVPMPDGQVRRVQLQDAVNAWLGQLGAASSIEVRDTGRLGYDVRVAQPGLSSTVDLTSVGVGVSQVVPVVLACLLAEPGTVVLLEQPELHLHPAMQQRLADFFLALAESGRQVIIETHSEYLVTRLRLRVAEDRTNRVADELRFINASKKGPRTEFHPVTVNRFGTFEDWPEGFFDQAAEESQALLRAGLAKKAGD